MECGIHGKKNKVVILYFALESSWKGIRILSPLFWSND